MRKIIYQKPHVIVRIINPEELLQVVVDSNNPIDAGEGQSKYQDFEDDFDSDNIWED